MRIKPRDARQDFSKAIRDIRDGRQVLLTEQGTPIAIVERLWAASKEQTEVIQSLINSGLLQPVRKPGCVLEWKWKSSHIKVA